MCPFRCHVSVELLIDTIPGRDDLHFVRQFQCCSLCMFLSHHSLRPSGPRWLMQHLPHHQVTKPHSPQKQFCKFLYVMYNHLAKPSQFLYSHPTDPIPIAYSYTYGCVCAFHSGNWPTPQAGCSAPARRTRTRLSHTDMRELQRSHRP